METNFKVDFLGNELKEGDDIVFTTPRCRGLGKGKLLYFSDKMARVEYLRGGYIKQTSRYLTEIVKAAKV